MTTHIARSPAGALPYGANILAAMPSIAASWIAAFFATDASLTAPHPFADMTTVSKPRALACSGLCERLTLYGIGPKYSNPSMGIAIAAITITAVLNCRFSLRLLPLLRSSTRGGACTGFTAIYALQISQDTHTAYQAT